MHRSPLREDGQGAYPTLLASKWLESSSATVWKIVQGLSSALLRQQEAADCGFFGPFERLRNPISGLIPIFQTVSPRTPLHGSMKRKAGTTALSRSPCETHRSTLYNAPTFSNSIGVILSLLFVPGFHAFALSAPSTLEGAALVCELR